MAMVCNRHIPTLRNDLLDTTFSAVREEWQRDTETSPLAAHYEHNPYGNLVYASSEGNGNANPFRFSTKWFDAETHLGYWGYRYYSPRLGRWLSRDPIEEGGGINLYAFVRNLPVGLIDHLGLANMCEACWCAGNPLCCGPAYEDTEQTRSEVKKRYGTDKDDTVFNAIKHCVWMCKVAGNRTCNCREAKRLGDCHESGPNTEAQKEMDLANNVAGRHCAGCGGRSGRDGGGYDRTWEECFACCEKEALYGGLAWISSWCPTTPAGTGVNDRGAAICRFVAAR